MICVRAQCAPTAEGQTTTLHPKGMNKGLKESLRWHTKFQFQQGNKQGKKQKRRLHSQFEGKSTSPPTVPQGAPNFSCTATLYNLLPSLMSFFGPNHRPNFIPNYPKEILSSWHTNWVAYLTIPAVLDAHGNEFSPAQPSGLPTASPSYHSKIRHPLSSVHIHQMNISWTETQKTQTQGTTVFINRKFLYLQLQNQDYPQLSHILC